jgi:hypothetical protein
LLGAGWLVLCGADIVAAPICFAAGMALSTGFNIWDLAQANKVPGADTTRNFQEFVYNEMFSYFLGKIAGDPGPSNFWGYVLGNPGAIPLIPAIGS